MFPVQNAVPAGHGRVHVYTGDGKGKSTAALGLALRAAGSGLRVLVVAFAKGAPAGEWSVLRRFPELVTLQSFGPRCALQREIPEEQARAALDEFHRLREDVAAGRYDVVVLDELTIALLCGLLPVEEVLALIERRPTAVELVITGRYADPRLLEKADLVTDMREVKHYYREGVLARVGIDR
jgi:cob(I)alamin adenosyltransferase